ncbi:O-Antigen ligase [Mycobacterium sp. JS623]|uniref:O-antigen ligase family protein n=1 Tax=Mycobacterium sp. JS623 TaxID=212767 RepID=UPI0002A56865|nr:O-antigen ligase family protein [Mycobacterium sp. JS623]AGB21352.1 O-Antigen ligase [Mycobacterium sp. JS623]
MDESGSLREDRRVEHATLAIVAVCLLLFVDVPLPLIGNSSRLVAVLIIPLLLLGRGGVRTPFCAAMYLLLPLYILFPIFFLPNIDTFEPWKRLALELVSLAGMVLLARALASDEQRLKLTDMLVIFALASSAVAALQRFGILGPVGRDRWGYSTTASGDLRGAGFLADPNFLAILLASVVPLIVSWRFARLRGPALVVLALGLYATNSRAGILLAVVALAVSVMMRPSTRSAGPMTRGRKTVILVAVCLVALFAFNVGGQRDRAVQAFLIGAGIQNSVRTGHAVDAFVARERRQLLESWINLGMKHFPVGVGTFEQTEVAKAAHNTFATLFGQGGIVGLAIALTILACLACFFRRRSEPYAIMGAVIVLGGLTLSYPGMVFLVLPMGLADGILAGRLGTRLRPGSESPPSHPRRGGLPAAKQVADAHNGADLQVPLKMAGFHMVAWRQQRTPRPS